MQNWKGQLTVAGTPSEQAYAGHLHNSAGALDKTSLDHYSVSAFQEGLQDQVFHQLLPRLVVLVYPRNAWQNPGYVTHWPLKTTGR